jgi:hypothetical protein
MTAETKLAQALEEALRYVVTAVIDCNGAHCNEPCCQDCQGLPYAEGERSAAVRVNDASTKVLREWKAGQI